MLRLIVVHRQSLDVRFAVQFRETVIRWARARETKPVRRHVGFVDRAGADESRSAFPLRRSSNVDRARHVGRHRGCWSASHSGMWWMAARWMTTSGVNSAKSVPMAPVSRTSTRRKPTPRRYRPPISGCRSAAGRPPPNVGPINQLAHHFSADKPAPRSPVRGAITGRRLLTCVVHRPTISDALEKWQRRDPSPTRRNRRFRRVRSRPIRFPAANRPSANSPASVPQTTPMPYWATISWHRVRESGRHHRCAARHRLGDHPGKPSPAARYRGIGGLGEQFDLPSSVACPTMRIRSATGEPAACASMSARAGPSPR